MKSGHYILAFCLLFAACAFCQTTIINAPPKDPEVKPEQLTATIVHYEKMRLAARRAISILALALQNTKGSSPQLTDAIDNQQDIVGWANWCILALRDNTPDALTCAFPPGLSPGLNDRASSEGVCQLAQNSVVRSHCSQPAHLRKPTESTD